jgi:hypothetical protein
MNDSESDSDSDYSLWSRGSDNRGKLYVCKKRKLNISVNDYTYPSPNKNKAIQQSQIKLHNEINSKNMQENK